MSANNKTVQLGCAAFGLQCHPSEPLIAAGLIDGTVQLYDYNDQAVSVRHTWKLHKKASRAVTFIQDGRAIVSASAACAFRVADVESQQLVHTVKKVHAAPIYSLYSVNMNIMASGDDDGVVKLWDIRQRPIPVMQESACCDRISDLVSDGKSNVLLATSGDGTLSVFNFRKRKLLKQSDPNECDLNCASIIKNGKKVACGTGAGSIHIYSWSEWGDMSDRCRMHSGCESVDASVVVGDSRMCVACDDGTLRIVQIHPNKLLGVLGSHDAGEPIERMSVTHDGRYVVSASLDETMRLWNVEEFLSTVRSSDDESEDDKEDDDSDDDDDDSDNNDDDDDDSDGDSGGVASVVRKSDNKSQKRDNSDSDVDKDSDSDDGANEKEKAGGKRKQKPAKQPAAKRKKPAGKGGFFADLC